MHGIIHQPLHQRRTTAENRTPQKVEGVPATVERIDAQLWFIKSGRQNRCQGFGIHLVCRSSQAEDIEEWDQVLIDPLWCNVLEVL